MTTLFILYNVISDYKTLPVSSFTTAIISLQLISLITDIKTSIIFYEYTSL